MALFIKEPGKQIKRMDMELLSRQMAIFLKEPGKQILGMDKALLSMRMADLRIKVI